MAKNKPAAKKQKDDTFSREKYKDGYPLGNMILGLTDEIEYAEKNEKKQWLKDGQRLKEMGDLWLYEFPLEQGFDFEPDEDVSVAINGRDYRGLIVKVDLASVVIGVDENQGEHILHVAVTKAENAIEKLLRKQLVEVFDGKSSLRNEQANLAIGTGAPEVLAIPIPDIINDYLKKAKIVLNPEQEKFLEHAIETKFSLLWGPPGCGKTTLIGLLTAALNNQDKRVLLVSNTNKAVDGALSAVLHTLKEVGRLNTPEKIVRAGTGAAAEFKGEWSKHLLEVIVREKGAELEEEKQELAAEQGEASSRLSRCERALEDYDEHRKAVSREAELPREIQELEILLEKTQKDLNSCIEKKHALENELLAAPEKVNLAGRITGKREREVVEADINECEKTAKTVEGSLQETQLNFAALNQEKSELGAKIKILAVRLKKYSDEKSLNEEKSKIQNHLKVIKARISEIDKALADMKQDILSNASVIGTTVHKTFLDAVISKLDFDAVIVDEASMVVLPMVYWAAGLSKSQVIVVGDFRQLPAIVKNNESELVKNWLACSPFEKWDVPDAVNTGKTSDLPFLFPLQTQNRMHPEIGDLVSTVFYHDLHTSNGTGLLPGPKAEEQAKSEERLPGQKTDKRLILVDTDGLGAWSSRPFDQSGRFNPTHVALSLALIDRLALAGVLDAGADKEKIGYVTPYAGQARLFEEASKGRYQGIIDDRSIGTVHRFQGGERDIMIFDYVLSESRKKPSLFIDAQTREDQPARLLNVAVSRAKSHLILIYNSGEFGEKNTHPWMQKFFNEFRSRAEELNAKNLLEESDILGQVRELSMGRRFSVDEPQTLHDEMSFYGAVREDLMRAQERITIFSAFATPNNLARWGDLFQTLLKRGIKIRIVTKPPRLQPKPKTHADQLKAMFDALRKAGVVLDTRPMTHEKAVVIDETVVWHGSLNMFSQNMEKTTEMMTRTVSADYSKQLLQMLSRHDLRQNDLDSPQMPACPTCGGVTNLQKGRSGKNLLYCEQSCGFIANSWDFHRIRRGTPIGRRMHDCKECKNGVMTAAQSPRGKTYVKCSNYNECGHKEDMRISDFGDYEPYPKPPKPDPAVLDGFANQAQAEAEEKPETADSKQKKQQAVKKPRQTTVAGKTKKASETAKQGGGKKTKTASKPAAPSQKKTKPLRKGQAPRSMQELDDMLANL